MFSRKNRTTAPMKHRHRMALLKASLVRMVKPTTGREFKRFKRAPGVFGEASRSNQKSEINSGRSLTLEMVLLLQGHLSAPLFPPYIT